MSRLLSTNAQIAQGDYVVASTTAQGAAYDNLCGQQCEFPDVDVSTSSITKNSEMMRQCVLVKNGSGGTLAAGDALNWVTNYWGTQVQNCPAGSSIRCYVPSYIRGSTSNTIPANAYFFAVFKGPLSVMSDGSAIAVNDGLVVGAASGQVRTDYGLGGGLVYSSVAASTAVTATTVATKFDQNYTFPVKSLNAGDNIRIIAQAIATATNSTDTLTLDLMIGTTVIATTGAIDVANSDAFEFISDLEIRTSGASGTVVGSTIVNTATGSVTFKDVILASATIDTTAVQQVALRATWSTNNAGNSCRQDIMNIARLNTNGVGLKSGTCIVAASAGSAVQFRASVNCQW